jgi:hypothetical protein
VTLSDFGYPAYALWFYCSQGFLYYKCICISNHSTLSIPDDGDSRCASCALNLISTYLFDTKLGDQVEVGRIGESISRKPSI